MTAAVIEQQVIEESRRFRAALPALLATYAGRWVIFKAGAVEGAFDDEDDAYRDAIRRYGLQGGFVIARVVEESGPTPITAGIHLGRIASP